MLGEEYKVKEIKRLCSEGKSLLSISEELGLSLYHVKTLMDKHGIVKDNVNKSKINKERIIELFVEQKLGVGVIAKRLGVSGTTVTKVLQEEGLLQPRYKKRLVSYD